MEDLRSIPGPDGVKNEKERSRDGINTIGTSIEDGDDSGRGQIAFDDVEAHIRYKEFKVKQVHIQSGI